MSYHSKIVIRGTEQEIFRVREEIFPDGEVYFRRILPEPLELRESSLRESGGLRRISSIGAGYLFEAFSSSSSSYPNVRRWAYFAMQESCPELESFPSPYENSEDSDSSENCPELLEILLSLGEESTDMLIDSLELYQKIGYSSARDWRHYLGYGMGSNSCTPILLSITSMEAARCWLRIGYQCKMWP